MKIEIGKKVRICSLAKIKKMTKPVDDRLYLKGDNCTPYVEQYELEYAGKMVEVADQSRDYVVFRHTDGSRYYMPIVFITPNFKIGGTIND